MNISISGGVSIGVPDRIDPLDGCEGKIAVRTSGEAASVSIWAERKENTPLNGRQDYLDPEQGITYSLSFQHIDEALAIYQHKNWWVRPAFPQELRDIPDRTQLLMLGHSDVYIVILAVCGPVYRSDISGTDEGITVRVSSNQFGRKTASGISLVIAWGGDPYRCIRNAAMRASEELGRPEILRRNKYFPECFKKLGWCSWDAFYQKVNAQGLRRKAEELCEKHIPESWMLIDDGWLDIDDERQMLKGLDADPVKFPGGLGKCVQGIKKDYGIQHVGVWHSLMGYWNGVQEGSTANQYFGASVQKLPEGRVIPADEKGRAFSFYDTWHSFLKNQCGIDFVKVDGQSAASLFLRHRSSFGEASAAYQKGLAASACMNFDGNIINCMGMAPEDIWNRTSASLIRTSDDFVPDDPHGFPEHALQNGFNSLWTGPFYFGDWDMFFSAHPDAVRHSILRAVSGGPVYTSDKVGETDPETIMPLILSDGTVIACDDVGVPTRDCLFVDPVLGGKVLKLFNHIGDTYVVAAFHVSDTKESEEGVIQISDIPSLLGGEWILFDRQKMEVSPLSGKNGLTFHLDQGEAKIFLIIPAAKIVPIGIREKYLATGCLEEVIRSTNRLWVILKEGGTFLFYGDFTDVCINGEHRMPEIAGTGLYSIAGCREGDIIEIVY